MRCLVGLHKWVYSPINKDLQKRICFLCGRKEEATYDMGTGDTIWSELK